MKEMFSESCKRRIAIIGVYPPPVGGISVHVRRVAGLLAVRKTGYVVYDRSPGKKASPVANLIQVGNFKLWLLKYMLNCKDRLVHYHAYTNGTKEWLIIFILSLAAGIHNSGLMVTIHSFRENTAEHALLRKLLFRFIFKKVGCFITVDEKGKDGLTGYGCREDRIYVIPAFMAPSDEECDSSTLPVYMLNFINSNSVNIAVNGSAMAFYKGKDLYGIDMCLDLCRRLNETYKGFKTGLVICLPGLDGDIHFKLLKTRVSENGLCDRILLVTETVNFCSVLKKCSIFVRPTNTDGDAVSVREALYCRVPVVASDAAVRPEGAILFKSRSFEDFFDKVAYAIENYDLCKERLAQARIQDYSEQLLEKYDSMLGGVVE